MKRNETEADGNENERDGMEMLPLQKGHTAHTESRERGIDREYIESRCERQID